jgi:hypothetical protein
MKCRLCKNDLSARDATIYGGRCEDCYCGGLIKPVGGTPLYVESENMDSRIPFDDIVKMQRGRARNGQVVHSGRAHGSGM